MSKYVKRDASLIVALVLVLFVFLVWIRLWVITNVAYLAQDHPPGMSEHGQFGDAFGSLNALFTGLALAGLVYTAILQRKQLDEQREELKAQDEAARENRSALAKQNRAQFLSARLQAETALLQAESEKFAGYGRATVGVQGVVEHEATRSASRRRIAIMLLLIEARQGFDDQEWSPSVEKEATRIFLVNRVHAFVKTCDRLVKDNAKDHVSNYVKDVRMELEILLDAYLATHRAIKVPVESIVATLDRLPNEFDSAVEWLRSADLTVLSRDSGLWKL
jgi:hypothetical protein